MKAKLFFPSVLAIAIFVLTGCTPTLSNLTRSRISQNPSGIYTLSMTPRNIDGAVIKDSYRPSVVINGQEYPMKKSSLDYIFDFDYALPEGIREARYYYILRYNIDHRGTPKPREIKSKIYSFALTNRYVISLESQRGPVGAEIPVIGRGFSDFDKIVVGGADAETKYTSPNVLSFFVPSLPAGQAYPVELITGDGKIELANFHVDQARFKVGPQRLELTSGGNGFLVIGIDFYAPAQGLPIEVTTNIPDSIIMQEVLIPPGAQSVNIPVEGGAPNSGNLFISAPGFEEVVVPVTVAPGANGYNPAPVESYQQQTYQTIESTQPIYESNSSEAIIQDGNSTIYYEESPATYDPVLPESADSIEILEP